MRTVVALIAFLLMPSLPSHANEPSDQAWDQALGLTDAQDINPDPNVVEINLTAAVAEVEIAPGRKVKAWTYNGTLPGPTIRTKVGNRLIVHFKNDLPAPTTVHWHGLQVPIQMDGVPGASQPDVPPGGTFTYDFVVPDASLFWYHPHVMSAAQVGFGLYGAFLVEDPNDGVDADSEQIIVLSDIDINEKGQVDDPETGGSAGMAFGREGNVLLVNGRHGARATVPSGVTQRWRVVNAAKSRYFDVDAGTQHKFLKIGVDGGFMEYAVELSTLVLAPGERADVLITPTGSAGSELAVIGQLFDRGYGSIETRLPETLFTLVMGPGSAKPAATPPKVTRAIAPLDLATAKPVSVEFNVSQDTLTKDFFYTLNGQPLGKFKPIPATVGQTQVWTITNPSPWSHPFHLHGFFFQVLDDNGQPVRPLAWKDTVSVPHKGSVRVAVRYDDRPGLWMFHCHVLDHAEGGLMGSVHLTREGDPSAPAPEHVHPQPAGSR